MKKASKMRQKTELVNEDTENYHYRAFNLYSRN